LLPVSGEKNLSEPEHLKSEWCGGRWRMGYGGHQTKDRGQSCIECDPQRPALGEQPQKQPEKADGEHGEVPGAGLMTGPMIRGGLMRAAHRTGRGLVLRCVLSVAGALRRVADQVQGPEDPVAEEQRADEQHGQLPGAEQLHR
jgi:hypothetical protein